MKRNIKNIIGFDCEGDAGAKGFISAAFITDKERYYTTDQDDAIAFIQSYAAEDSVFVATNLEYDLAVIFQGALDLIRLFYADNRLLYAALSDKSAKVEFWDTLRCIGLYSVAKLGQMVNLQKLHTPPILTGDYDNTIPWSCIEHSKEYCNECYNCNDAEISRRAFLLFFNGIKEIGGQLQKTIASTSINVWKKMIPNNKRVSLIKNLDPLCREGYYGGRPEVFDYGRIFGLNKYDVNSLYPSVMLNNPYPDVEKMECDTPGREINYYRRYYGVVNVEIEVPEMRIPPLPFRHNDKLVFPVGTWRGTYVIQELFNAMRFGVKVRKVYWACYSRTSWWPFVEFVETLYAKRMEFKAQGNPMENVYKILMNALYGKFGQRLGGNIGWLVILSSETESYLTKGAQVQFIGDESWVQIGVNRHYSPFYLNVLWAAYVTAYGRMKLYDYFAQVDFDVSYCDTDSIFTHKILPSSKDLGDVKLEGENLECTFLGPKFYKMIGDDGVPHFALKGAPPNLMMDYFAGKEIEFTVPVKIKTGVKQGLTPGTWRKIHRQFSYEFDKRTLDPRLTNGLTGNCTTSPLVLVNGKPEAEIEARTESIFAFERSPDSFIRKIVAKS